MKPKKVLLFPLLFSLVSCSFETIDPSKMDVDVKYTEWNGEKIASGSLNYKKLTNEVYDDIDYATYTSLTFIVNPDRTYESLTGFMLSVYSLEVYELYFNIYIAPKNFDVDEYKMYKFDSSIETEDNEIVKPYYESEEAYSVTTDPSECVIPYFGLDYEFDSDKVQIVIEISDSENFSIAELNKDGDPLYYNSYEYVISVDDIYFTIPAE